jgi:hypothetical protein
MDITTIMLLHGAPPSPLTAEERAQFRAEQQCRCSICGLPPVTRVFVGG